MKAEWSNKDSLEMPTTTTNDYIKREDAIQAVDRSLDAIDHVPQWVFDDWHIAIENVPPADVVEVVRCKDCKYRKKVLNCSYGECMYSACMVTDNDFCSNGEAKTNEQEQWDV